MYMLCLFRGGGARASVLQNRAFNDRSVLPMVI